MKRIQIRFISLISEHFLKAKRAYPKPDSTGRKSNYGALRKQRRREKITTNDAYRVLIHKIF